MLVVMQQGATEEQVDTVIGRMVELGFNVHRSTGVVHTVLGGVGGPDPAVKFAQNEDPYARALRITDRRFGTPRADVGPAPLYDGQDEAGTLLNDWQRADSLKYFRAR